MVSKPFFAPVLGYAAAAGEANHVVVERTAGGVFRVVDTGATITAGPGCTSVSPSEVSCVGADNVVLVRAGDRDDFFSFAGAGFAVVHGEDGNDTLDVGGVSELYGGPGADTLRGGDNPAFQLLKGEEGDDELIGGESGENRLVGGPGADTLRAGPGGDELLGSAGNDLLLGGNRPDLVFGQGGNDRVSAGGGRDIVLGHGGRDVLRGGPDLTGWPAEAGRTSFAAGRLATSSPADRRPPVLHLLTEQISSSAARVWTCASATEGTTRSFFETVSATSQAADPEPTALTSTARSTSCGRSNASSEVS